ncbi:MAG: NAD-dependent epimerase/dehydratase family protein [Candidatus Micrarchaeota archaeon]
MEVVVTGGAGFIGSNLAKALVGAGHAVGVIDNLHSGSMENLAGADVKFWRGNAGDIEKSGLPKPQVIFHEGIYSSSPMYNADRTLISKAVGDFVSLLEYARKNDCEIVFAATSSVYNGVAPPHREDATIPVSDFYTEPRLMMERGWASSTTNGTA